MYKQIFDVLGKITGFQNNALVTFFPGLDDKKPKRR